MTSLDQHRGPALTLDAATAVCAEAFRCSEGDLVGLEVEWPTRTTSPAAPDRRPSPEQMGRLEAVVLPAGGRVTWEPGGQIELSTAPASRVDDLLHAVRTDDRALGTVLDHEGLTRLAVSVDQTRPPRRVVDRPRYAAMEAYFDAQGPCGRQMMTATAGTQVNVSHCLGDPARRWRVLHQVGPVLLACFASSPGSDADGRRWTSLRQGIWSRIDPARTRAVPPGRDPVLAWRDYALAADVFFVPDPGSGGASGTPVPPGLSFGDWMVHGHALGRPTTENLAYHLTTLFPPIRPKGWLELRFLDLLPADVLEVAVLCAAVLVTLNDDEVGLLPDVGDAWVRAARHGLEEPTLRRAAQVLLDLVSDRVPRVSDDPARVEAVAAFRGRHVPDARLGRGPTPSPH